VVLPDRSVAVYGYPRDVFPPTDFHTATLDGSSIWIVGSLGYERERKQGTTQVCRLDLATMAIEQIATTGDSPGWIHKHEAQLESGSIVVRGGIVDHAGRPAFDENIDDWALDLATRTWTRRTTRDWQRWAVRRADGERILMWELRQMKWRADNPRYAGTDHFSDDVREKLGSIPDLSLLDGIYRCEGATVLPNRESDDYNVFRIELDGIVVRFTEEGRRIAAMVEGVLSEDRLLTLQDHVIARLVALQLTVWELESAGAS
jgi:hypothetical protein